MDEVLLGLGGGLVYFIFIILILAFGKFRRGLFFPWSVLDYGLRKKPRFKSKLFFSKTIYYTIFYIKNSILTILLWPFLLRRIKSSKDYQVRIITFLFYLFFVIWFLVIIAAFAIAVLTKWLQIFVFLPLMRIIFLILFEVYYRKNKKLLFKKCSKQDLLDFKGDNMHKPEKSLLTYKESYQYGETYKKFTIPVFCSSPIIDLNYKVFDINRIYSYKKAKEKLIEVLGDEFFVFLEKLDTYINGINNTASSFKKEVAIIYTLIKRLDYNCIFLYFIPDLYGSMVRNKIGRTLLEEFGQLIRFYIEKNVYIKKPIFQKVMDIQAQAKVFEKDDEEYTDDLKSIFYYDLFFTDLRRKYYFCSSDGKMDFTHPFLPVFFFNSKYIKEFSHTVEKNPYEIFFHVPTGSVIAYNNMFFWALAFCY